MSDPAILPLRFIALWPTTDNNEHARLRVFTGNQTHRCEPVKSPAASTALADCLPRAACDLIRESRCSSVPVALLIDASLPKVFQLSPWETLLLDGTPVLDAVIVVRNASVCFASGEPATSGAQWLDLFPKSDFNFSASFAPLVEEERLRPRLPNTLHRGLDGVSDFFVLAHGTAQGLCDSTGDPFFLPPTHALPERIWLLACNRNQSQHELARQLITRGARTVITAVGDLNANEIAGLVHDWTSRPSGTRLVPWLASQRKFSLVDGGVRALTVWGKVSLWNGEGSEWNHRTWQAEYASSPHPLYLNENDRGEFDRALHAADSPTLWEATKSWLHPQLLWLSEKNGHSNMLKLLPKVSSMTSPIAEHALADTAYRLGQYPDAANHLVRGLSVTGIAVQDEVQLLGGLTNLLIDLNLPQTAYRLTERHEDCVLDDPVFRSNAELKRLDWRARIAMRQGKFNQALQSMSRKKQRANSDDGRELAWLLYIGTWNDLLTEIGHPETNAWGDEALMRVQGVDLQLVGDGNHNESYLIRSLAAFAWLNRSSETAAWFADRLPVFRSKLRCVDPGPWAFSLAYLYLANITIQSDFDEAMHALSEARYFFEAASFCSLAGDLPQASDHLRRFQKRRQLVLESLAPSPHIQDMALTELQNRLLLEDVLLSKSQALAGLMPM